MAQWTSADGRFAAWLVTLGAWVMGDAVGTCVRRRFGRRRGCTTKFIPARASFWYVTEIGSSARPTSRRRRHLRAITLLMRRSEVQVAVARAQRAQPRAKALGRHTRQHRSWHGIRKAHPKR